MNTYSVSEWMGHRKNIVLVGESGCGKSEAAVNFALALAEQKKKEVHLFDMDQTKPLFRSRDARKVLEDNGVICHGEPQLLDTPVMAGGVRHCLEDRDCYVVLDAGGNAVGARLIGWLSPCLDREDTAAGYLVNPYRPWSRDIRTIDAVLTEVLRAARISAFHVIASPGLGQKTTASEFLEGCGRLVRTLGQYVEIEFAVVMDSLYEEVKEDSPLPLLPIHLYLSYPWNSDEE